MKRSLLAALLAFSLPTLAAAPMGARTRVDRVARAPANQAGVDNTVSRITMTSPIALPPGKNSVSFDYAVDSQPGGDFLELWWLNSANVATFLWKESGLKSGHVDLVLPAAGGATRLQFRYSKDASLHRYLDSGWVDEVVVKQAGGKVTRWDFDESLSGWTTSATGFTGSWSATTPRAPVAATRPAAQVGVAGKSYFERGISFPTAAENAVSFDYLLDANTNDALNVYLDPLSNPTPVFTVKGANKAGHVELNAATGVVIGAGAHVIRFEYAKVSTGAGLDLARVDNVVASSNGVRFETHRFEGRTLGVAPIKVGSNPAEWASGGIGGGWVAAPVLPHRSYVPMQQVGASFATDFGLFAEPVVDGRVQGGEYANATPVRIRNLASTTAAPADLRLVTSKSSNTLSLGLRARGGTTAAGSESGTFTIYLDADHAKSLKGLSCGNYGQLPGPEDRKLVVTYTIGAGPLGSATVTQLKGSCATWQATTSAELWPVTAAVSEPETDAGWVHFELRIGLPASALNDKRLGLAFTRATTSGTWNYERLPYRDDVAAASDNDVFSWETVELDYQLATQRFSGAKVDGCCFPTPNQPGSSW